MENSDKSNFCIRPFNSIVVSTDGSLRPCCQIKKKKFNIKNIDIKEYWDSDYLRRLRKKFLKNQKPKECSSCWNDENKKLISHRLKSNFEYQAIFKNNYIRNLKLIKKFNLYYPEDIDLAITNICNLKCQMCSGAQSSKLLIENNALKFENISQNDFNLKKKNLLKYEKIIEHDVKLLNLRGGEPLANKTILTLIKKIINADKAKSIALHITTNGTICNEKLLTLLSNFKSVRIMFSIESTGKFNNYLRYPSNWKDIEKNILNFKSLKNTYLYINTVVQNLNILYLEPLINFANQHDIFLNFCVLKTPIYLELDNLPLNILQTAYEKLIKIDKNKLIHTKNVNEMINYLENIIKNYRFDQAKFNMFTDMIKKRDRYRKISIADYMPEIHEII